MKLPVDKCDPAKGKHTVECNVQHDTDMANKTRRDALKGADKHRVNRERARQRARSKKRHAAERAGS